MSNGKIFGLAIAGTFALLVMWGIGSANGLVTKDESVKYTYAQVQNVLQRQADLIPNLVETVKAYAKFEQDTFTQVANARAKAGGVTNINATDLANNPEKQQQLLEASQSMSGALSRLLMIQEKYPELKANQGFQDLRTELTGSINRITVERKRNQEAVQDFNRSIRRFPTVVIARTLGYSELPYFTATPDSTRPPNVRF